MLILSLLNLLQLSQFMCRQLSNKGNSEDHPYGCGEVFARSHRNIQSDPLSLVLDIRNTSL